jgi:probable blue pigment (indigoidine) exporter
METKKNAYATIFITSLLWGTTYPTIKFGLSHMHLPPISFLLMRFLIAFVALCPVLFIKRVRNEVRWSFKEMDIILLGLFAGLCYSLQFIGQVNTTAGVATVFINTYVLFTPLFGKVLLEKDVNRKQIIAAVSGFFGVVIIVLGDLLWSSTDGVTLAGILFVFGSGLFTGLYITYSEKVHRLRYRGKNLHPVTIFFTSTFYSLVVMCFTGLIRGDLPKFLSLNLPALAAICYLALFCTDGAFVLYLIAVRDLGSVNSAVFMLFQIIVSMCISFIALKEIPDIFMYTGTGIITFAMVLTGFKRRKVVPSWRH